VKPPWIVAHRGAMDEAPENTAAAFEAALTNPIDGIELDVQMTSDGHLVIYHDAHLKKITGDAIPISHYKYAELTNLDWGAWFNERFRGGRLLTLRECLREFAPRTRLLIEVKSFADDRRSGRSLEIARRVAEELEEFPAGKAEDAIRILSFDPAVLAEAARRGRWRCVQNLDDPSVLPELEAPDYLDAWCAPIERIDPGMVDACHERGRRFMTWTCNTPRDVRKARECRCDVIMTDRPAWICRYLKRTIPDES
jgi:glycerophosphoryl diester phosphodiesterase